MSVWRRAHRKLEEIWWIWVAGGRGEGGGGGCWVEGAEMEEGRSG